MTEQEASDILAKLTFTIVKKKSLDKDTKNLILMALGEAIKLIEKQIPKKPQFVKNRFLDRKDRICPICKIMLSPHTDFTYCSRCGQKFDWSMEE